MKALAIALLSFGSAAHAQTCSDVIQVPVLPGFDASSASGITCDGSVVVGTSIDSAFTHFGAYRWSEAQGLLALGTLGGTASAAFGVSCQGEVIVGHAGTPTGQNHPFRWTATGGMEDLLAQAGLTGSGVAYGVSGDGGTIVGSYRSAGTRAFIWDASAGLQELPGLSFLPREAYDVSEDGLFAVGFSTNANSERRAIRWSAAGVIEDLGTLGGNSSEAYAISADGQVVVGKSRNAIGLEQPFRWTQATGMVPVDPSLSPFTDARAVNRDGSVIGGGDPTGLGGAYIWTPDGGVQAPILPDSLATTDITPDGSLLLMVGSSTGPAGNPVTTSYVIRSSPVGTKYCGAATANSTGCSGYISAVGTASVPADALTLSAARLPANTFGFFLTSQTIASPTTAPGSQGLLCLGGAIGRYVGAGQVQNTGAAGRVELRISMTALPTPTGLVAGMAGQTWSFQCWHRDANPSVTSNLTDAVSIVLR